MSDVTATSGVPIWLVGGSIRSCLLKDRPQPKDLDCVVEEGYSTVLRLLSRDSRVEQKGERSHSLYYPNGSHIDLFHPKSFFTRPATVSALLETFDISANAIALGIHDQTVLDPLSGIADSERFLVRPIPARWRASSNLQARHLLLRLVDLFRRQPLLTLTDSQIVREKRNALLGGSWRASFKCHGLLRYDAVRTLDELLSRAATGASYQAPDIAGNPMT